MKYRNIIIACGAVLLVAFVLLFVKDRSSEPTPAVGTISVITSFYPLAYFAQIVGGDRVSVKVLTPAGVEAHDFEPSSRDVAALGNADLFVYNGAHYEPWIEKWRTNGFERPREMVDMAAALTARGETLIAREGEPDPHFWLDPMIATREVEIIRDTLIQIDPPAREEYESNASRAIETLQELDERLTKGLASCVRRDMVVSHESFSYFAKRYQLNAIAIAGISPDEEPSPRALAKITDEAREKGIQYVFFETMVSPLLAETIAREISGGVLVLNPIENLMPAEAEAGEDYISLMNANLDNLRLALGCKNE